MEGWAGFLLSDAATRYAAGFVDMGIRIPQLSADPFVQWLLEEAMVLRLQFIRADEAQQVKEEQDAHALAREELDRIAPR